MKNLNRRLNNKNERFRTHFLFIFIITFALYLPLKSFSKTDQCSFLFQDSFIQFTVQFNEAKKQVIGQYDHTVVNQTEFNFIKSVFPDYLVSMTSPSQEITRRLDPLLEDPWSLIEQLSKSGSKRIQNLKILTEGFHIPLIQFLKSIVQFKGHYYFFGNGMELFREATKSLLEESEAQNHIHQLNISRILFDDPQFKTKIFKYFSHLGWGRNFQGKIILIDSIATPGRGSSLIKISDLLVEFLINDGLTQTEALNKVVPIAIPEVGSIYDEFSIESQSMDLAQNFQKIATKFSNLRDNKKLNIRPMISDKILYSYLRPAYFDIPKWGHNFKYVEFGAVDGVPTQINETFVSLTDKKKYEVWKFKGYMRARLEYLAFYKIIRDQMRELRTSSEIQSIVLDLNEIILHGPK